MNFVNFMNFVSGLSREHVIFSSLLRSLRKFIKSKGFRPESPFIWCFRQTRREVHNVHEDHFGGLRVGQ